METPTLNDIASITAEFRLKRFDELVEMRAKNKSWNQPERPIFSIGMATTIPIPGEKNNSGRILMPEICAYCNRRIRPGKGKTLKGDRICEGCLKLEQAHRVREADTDVLSGWL